MVLSFRLFCLKTGVQILLREYSFDSKNRLTFFEEDVINIFPVVKHINPRVCMNYSFVTHDSFIDNCVI